MLGSGFLSTLGNSMGDNLTAVPLLGGLYLVLRRWQALGRPGAGGLLTVLGAGLLSGAACGLKLTNAVYAVALCVALLTVPLAWWSRLRLAFMFGVGVLGGIAATAGCWARCWSRGGSAAGKAALAPAPLAQLLASGAVRVWAGPPGLAALGLWSVALAWPPCRRRRIGVACSRWCSSSSATWRGCACSASIAT